MKGYQGNKQTVGGNDAGWGFVKLMILAMILVLALARAPLLHLRFHWQRSPVRWTALCPRREAAQRRTVRWGTSRKHTPEVLVLSDMMLVPVAVPLS